MDKLFLIQIITSFIIGGTFIALQSLLAEKLNEKISGIIIAFPSTAAFGFFFLGWTTSAEAAANVVPASLIPFGLAVLFPTIYIYTTNYLKKYKIKKINQIIISFIVGIGFWFLLAIPVTILKFSLLHITLPFCLLMIYLSQCLLHRYDKIDKAPALKYTKPQQIGRIFFVGLIISSVVITSKLLNPFWGGMFAMFPAAFSSTMLIFNWYYEPEKLFPLMKKFPLGTLSIVAYVLVVMFTFPKIGIIWGTISAYIISLIVSTILAKIQNYNS